MTDQEEAKMTQETQGKTTNQFINQQQNTQKFTKDNDGLRPTRQPTMKPTIYLGFLKSMTFSGVVQTKLKPSSISL
jgi:predicted choloylglycine hydrolase